MEENAASTSAILNNHVVFFFHDPHNISTNNIQSNREKVFRMQHNDLCLMDDGISAKIMFEGQVVWKKFDVFLTSTTISKMLVMRDKQGYDRLGSITKTTVLKHRDITPPSVVFDVVWEQNRSVYCKQPKRPLGNPQKHTNKKALLEQLDMQPMTTTSSGIIPCMKIARPIPTAI